VKDKEDRMKQIFSLKRVACIGSREISPAEEKKMMTLGNFLVSEGWTIVSGNALGSDQAYARGGNQVDPSKVELCLPWPRYERPALVAGNHTRVVGAHDEDMHWALAAAAHPAWEHLKDPVRKLMVRNAMIIRRIDGDTFSNVEFVIARLNHNKWGWGGTGHGVRIAKALRIAVYDISRPDVLKRLMDEVRRKRQR
jgi:hypothetical protein